MKMQKKLLTLLPLLALFVVFAASVSAARYTDENGFVIEDKKLVGYSGDATEIVVPDGIETIGYRALASKTSVTSVTLPDTVTFIDTEAFRWSKALTSVTVPDSVIQMGSNVFADCTELKEVKIGAGLRTDFDFNTFYNTPKLLNITVSADNEMYGSADGVLTSKDGTRLLYYPHGRTAFIYAVPDGVTTVGSRAFEDCTDLTGVTLPSSLTAIDSRAFYGCTGLKSMTVPDSVKTIGEAAFYACKKMQTVSFGTSAQAASLQSIGKEAFRNCEALKAATLPDGLKRIGEAAFYRCYALTTLSLGNSLESMDGWAFGDCSVLTGVTIPDTLTVIPRDAFSYCYALADLTIPDGVARIDYNAFRKNAITSVSLPDSVTVMGEAVFCDCPQLASAKLPAHLETVAKDTFYGCGKLTSVVMPEDSAVIGENAFYGCKLLPAIDIPASVTAIGAGAFNGCQALTSVTLPDGLTVIDSYALAGMGIAEIVVPDTVVEIKSHAFYGCEKLTAVTVPDSVKVLRDNAFQGCKLLETIVLPDSITEMGSGVFKDCVKLKNVTLPSALTVLPANTFENCTVLPTVTIPENIVTIGSHAFVNCKGLTAVTVPAGVTAIADHAFYGCVKLTQVNLPDSLLSIGEGGFEYCEALPAITLPASVTSLGNYVFRGNKALTAIVIPAGVTKLNDSSFRDCVKLSDVTLNEGLLSIDEWAFIGCKALTHIELPSTLTNVERGAFNGCTALTEISFPDSVTKLGSEVLYDCAKLKKVKFPALLKEIPSHVCRGCVALTSITWPKAPTSLEYCAFYDCKSLSSVTIPDTVTKMSGYAFYGCTSLTGIVIPNSVKTLGDRVFQNCTSLVAASVPDTVESVDSYLFYDCTALTDVYYGGSEEQWNTLFVPKNPFNTEEVTVHFNSEFGGAKLTSVSVKTLPNKLQYAVGETLDPTGMVLLAKFSDNSTQEITADYTCAPTVMTNEGVQQIIVSYHGKAAIFSVTVGVAASDFAVTRQPENATVAAGQSVTFTVEATGDGLSYQWYYRKAGVQIWSKWNGHTTASTTAVTNASWNGMQVYCQITNDMGESIDSDPATITVTEAQTRFEIVEHPEDVTVQAGETVTFTVTADGENLSYQWYYRKAGAADWSKWNGRTTAATSATANESWNGMQVYCVVTDGSGNVLRSEPATVTVETSSAQTFRIIRQPQSITAALGDSVTLALAAEGDGLSYQWYFKKAGAAAFSKWNGRTHASETVTPNAGWNGIQLYCVVEDINGARLTSDTVTVTLTGVDDNDTEFAITRQPSDATVTLGDSVTLTVAAQGNGLTYQWYYKKKGAEDWSRWTSRTHASETVTPNATWDGIQLFCEVRDASGHMLESAVAKITVKNPVQELKITQQPKSQTVTLGSALTLTVAAQGDGLRYQWYYKKTGAEDWSRWTGRTHASETVTPNATWNGIRLFCEVRDAHGNSVDSDAATVTLQTPAQTLKITQQPKNQTITLGSALTLTVAAQGDGLKYQWYYKKTGAEDWSRWTGRTHASETVTPNATWNGIQLFCEVRDAHGNSVESTAAKITVTQTLKITQQPANASVKLGNALTLTVKAQGMGLSYQWYYKKAGETAWTKWSGRTHASETVTPNATWNGIQLYCAVKDSTGKTVNSSAAKITVTQELKITQQPANASVKLGNALTLTVKAQGIGLSYQWYYKKAGETAWTKWSGRTHASETVTPNATWNGIQLYCAVKDSTGKTVNSSAAKITVTQELKITQQPANVSVKQGASVTFTVKAQGMGLRYQWYYRKIGQTVWTAWGSRTTASTTATANMGWQGMQVMCKVTDSTGASVNSDPAVITVSSLITHL